MTARSSAKGLVAFLGELTESVASLPAELRDRLAHLADGYAVLGREVDGPDRSLDDVAQAWLGLTDSRAGGGSAVVPPGPITGPEGVPLPTGDVLTSCVDLRQVRARVVDIDPADSEIRMRATQLGDEPAVLVTVPAFRSGPPSAADADRLLVRLVDRHSGETRSVALLTLGDGDAASGAPVPEFSGVVPLGGAAIEDLRADVFDADSDVPPAPADTDTGLLRVRRAALVLREWRRTVAEARLGRDPGARARRLARVAHLMTSDVTDVTEPLFDGGPTTAELLELSAASAPAATAVGWATTTEGPGHLLVAELASALGPR